MSISRQSIASVGVALAGLAGTSIVHARSEEQIRQSFFGRVESVDRGRLYAPEVTAPLRALLNEIERLLGADEIQLPEIAPPPD